MSGPFSLNKKKRFRIHMGNHFIQFNIAPSEKKHGAQGSSAFPKAQS